MLGTDEGGGRSWVSVRLPFIQILRFVFLVYFPPYATAPHSVPLFALTYGVAGRGERRDGSVRRRVEWLLDFGADNPGKVNNRQRINQSCFQSMEISQRPGHGGTLKHSASAPLTAVHVQALRRLGREGGPLYPHIQHPPPTPLVANSQSRGFRANLAAPV